MPEQAFIGLGSNLGDRAAAIRGAIDELNAAGGVAVRRASSLYETPPVGGPTGQGPFLNAAAAIETTLPPRELLGVLQGIERDLGRVRHERWGQRTIDLDLLLYGDGVIDEPGLVVPHPRMVVRRFVLAPLNEVVGGFRGDLRALLGRGSVGGVLAELDQRPGSVLLRGPDPDGTIAAGVVAGLGAIGLAREHDILFQRGTIGADPERWVVLSDATLVSALGSLRARGVPGRDTPWPNLEVTWGAEAEASGPHGRRSIGLGGILLRIRAPEGGESSDDWVVAEVLAACAASRVPTRVVGPP